MRICNLNTDTFPLNTNFLYLIYQFLPITVVVVCVRLNTKMYIQGILFFSVLISVNRLYAVTRTDLLKITRFLAFGY